MLTRLKVTGFKNLDDIDVRLGPFSCVAGANGVGKSNLFDAIAFLSSLAHLPLIEAALAVRGGEARQGDVQSLFRRVSNESADRMKFLVEMIIPPRGQDELHQPAEASMTFLRYELELCYRLDPTIKSMGTLAVLHESMVHLNRGDARVTIGFPHTKAWRDSVIKGRRTSPYISTDEEKGVKIVALHGDSEGGKTGGRPRRVPASSLPRTMLSSVNNAAEHRTLVLAKQEMMSWTQLQLEPSALRAPDAFSAPRVIGANGAHLPATLYELAQTAEREGRGGAVNVYTRVANRLSQLIENVRRLKVDVDEKRQLLSIIMTDRHNTEHVASALSDGTLRFLALTVMEADARSRSLLCLEEPENGMHPSRIPAVIELLMALAVDAELPVDDDNPLRQVIINTHSPSIVACIPDDTLLVAEVERSIRAGQEASRLTLRHLPETWRQKLQPEGPVVTRGDLIAYLAPIAVLEEATRASCGTGRERRVMDRKDLQLSLFLQEAVQT